ncbi:hypothetical protein N9909_00230 [bacterium]|jgi:hypothetical protein|nr:hypothetical protein [bacterium]
MIMFDKLEDALEEAQWCAENEQKVYIIRRKGEWFKVMPKHRMQKYYLHIEVGYRGRK